MLFKNNNSKNVLKYVFISTNDSDDVKKPKLKTFNVLVFTKGYIQALNYNLKSSLLFS
jgi:hypothetical protein